MALIKTVQTPHGIEASYHKIIKVEYLIQEATLVIVVAVYVSEAAREAGSSPLWHEYVRIPFEHMDLDPRVNFYAALSAYTNSYLKDAERDSRPDPAPVVEVVEEAGPQLDEAPIPAVETLNG